MELHVPPHLSGRRLDEVLAELVSDVSRARFQKLVRRGCVALEGRPVRRSNVRVRGGQRLRVDLELPAPAAASPPTAHAAPRIEPLHLDDDLLVVDKPAGLLTHGVRGSARPNLAQALALTHGPLPTSLGDERPGVVHRLDRQTSGLIVLARNEAALAALKRQFAERSVEKRYAALVCGRLPVEDELEVTAAMRPHPAHADRQQLARDGKPALTRFALVERHGDHALVHAFPRTGRRHQIRLHLLARGLQLLGEELYELREAPALPGGCPRPKRHALHAAGLAFRHPRTGERLEFEAPLPDDMGRLLDGLRRAR